LKKFVFLVTLFMMLVIVFPVAIFAAEGKLTYGYITPGPDTWYKKDADGYVKAAKMLGIDTIVLNSDYDVQKEVANIESLITQGVDGIAIFSFNQQGAITAAKKCNKAGIPLVTVDNCGQVLETPYDIVAAIDFDWTAMGKNYAEYMAEKYPGAKVALITGLLEHLPVQMITRAMKERVEELGENKIVALRNGEYNPSVAVNQAQDLIQSGVEFDILWVNNEDMVAAVIRYLDNQDLLDKYTVMAQNGSPIGLELLKTGKLDYTISSSPGWEGMVSLFALHHYVTGATDKINQRIMLPIISVSKNSTIDKRKVIPWDYDPVWDELTKKYFPEFRVYLP